MAAKAAISDGKGRDPDSLCQGISSTGFQANVLTDFLRGVWILAVKP